ncbi:MULTISPECIES: folate-binding protein YgfZ [unclassified Corynebacterium]|uniref:CAF17-like 4Fe-4S cluster assembly/insertion protein YgfZ n=1 Tax=unclassified Corynebacterium TaxID=2624378 RepID=UPI0029CA18C3|nr:MULTISPECIES: folate-binding protein YgfZ [unclassified Corynebacterium]WPF65758.1 folate-binding protein YgfZ [Corynebacterium sp. 22KM0430]WPF68252.1 folate-binding protein YgfZ [Corynebacterium sp. 21KM1197]
MSDTTSYASPLLSLPGALPAHESDPLALGVDSRGVAWHYGDPLAEQRQTAESGVFIDRSHRTILRVTGEDAAGFLHNLLSQGLAEAPVGFHADALNLDAQGRVLHHAGIMRAESGFYLDLPRAQAEGLLSFLTQMIFWSKVEIAESSLGLITVLGASPALIDATPRLAWARSEGDRIDLAVERADLPEVAEALRAQGLQPAGLMAWTAHRVHALEPELSADLDAKTIPHEVPTWIGRGEHLGAVHLEKGCYRGQETVARVENIGRSPRLLVRLHLDGSVPVLPAPGTEITAQERRVGRLGTVVHDHEFGPIALGLIKRSALESPGLVAGDAALAVDTDSLPTFEGDKAGRAAMDRLRGR